MPKIIVLPTQEDIAALENGSKPENVLAYEFPTEAEATSFADGVGAVNNMAQYEILEDLDAGPNGKPALRVDIDDEIVDMDFESVAEKAAYVAGMECGEGFIEPEVAIEGGDEYDEYLARLSAIGIDPFAPAAPAPADG